jgi:hypothetical protein
MNGSEAVTVAGTTSYWEGNTEAGGSIHGQYTLSILLPSIYWG